MTRTEAKRRMFSSYLVAKDKTWYINFNMSKIDDGETEEIPVTFLTGFPLICMTC